LRVVIIFRMTATMMTLDFLSASARHPTTVDAAVSLELAAVEVIWCKADEGGTAKGRLFDHLVGKRKQLVRHVNAECASGL
jgi:hypothetical protein